MSILKRIPLKGIIAILFISSCAFAQYDNSRVVNQTVPSSMVPGVTYSVLVTFENIGSSYWTPYDYKLSIVPGPEARAYSTWGTTSRDLVSTVEPGKTVTFEFPVTAPYTSGVYTLQTQLIHGSTYFGQSSYSSVGVGTYPPPPVSLTNNSSFIDQTVSRTMTAGEAYKVVITMRNTGTASWTPGRYKLVNLNNSDANVILWGTSSVELDETVWPGQSKSFVFTVTPPLAGSHLFQWKMSVIDEGLFGDASTPLYIDVQSRTGSIEDRNAYYRTMTNTSFIRAERATSD